MTSFDLNRVDKVAAVSLELAEAVSVAECDGYYVRDVLVDYYNDPQPLGDGENVNSTVITLSRMSVYDKTGGRVEDRVAAKICPDDPMTELEVQVLTECTKALTHWPNLPALYGTAVLNENPDIVDGPGTEEEEKERLVLSELADGTLKSWISERLRTEKEWHSMIYQVLLGLCWLQNQLGLVHDDSHWNNFLYLLLPDDYPPYLHYRLVRPDGTYHDLFVPHYGHLWLPWDFGNSYVLHPAATEKKKKNKDGAVEAEGRAAFAIKNMVADCEQVLCGIFWCPIEEWGRRAARFVPPIAYGKLLDITRNLTRWLEQPPQERTAPFSKWSSAPIAPAAQVLMELDWFTQKVNPELVANLGRPYTLPLAVFDV